MHHERCNRYRQLLELSGRRTVAQDRAGPLRSRRGSRHWLRGLASKGLLG